MDDGNGISPARTGWVRPAPPPAPPVRPADAAEREAEPMAPLVRRMLALLGEDPDREGLVRTPGERQLHLENCISHTGSTGSTARPHATAATGET